MHDREEGAEMTIGECGRICDQAGREWRMKEDKVGRCTNELLAAVGRGSASGMGRSVSAVGGGIGAEVGCALWCTMTGAIELLSREVPGVRAVGRIVGGGSAKGPAGKRIVIR